MPANVAAAAIPTPRLGTYITTSVAGENVRAFVPPPLPPAPPLHIDSDLQDLFEKASRGLGRLDGVTRVFSDPELFLYMYVRKEALLSSQIEGTQSSFSDLLLFESEELPGVPINDVEEVSHYVAAMNHALERLRGGFPLSLRNVEDLLHERGIDVSHETVRYWWNRFAHLLRLF